jgi:hypothetical protein
VTDAAGTTANRIFSIAVNEPVNLRFIAFVVLGQAAVIAAILLALALSSGGGDKTPSDPLKPKVVAAMADLRSDSSEAEVKASLESKGVASGDASDLADATDEAKGKGATPSQIRTAVGGVDDDADKGQIERAIRNSASTVSVRPTTVPTGTPNAQATAQATGTARPAATATAPAATATAQAPSAITPTAPGSAPQVNASSCGGQGFFGATYPAGKAAVVREIDMNSGNVWVWYTDKTERELKVGESFDGVAGHVRAVWSNPCSSWDVRADACTEAQRIQNGSLRSVITLKEVLVNNQPLARACG